MTDSPATSPGLAALGSGDTFARVILQESPLSTVVYDAEGHPVFVNRAFERLFGITLESAPPDYTVFRDEQLERAGVVPLIRRAFAGERVHVPAVRYDTTVFAAGGRSRYVEGILYPLRADDGSVRAVVLVHLDQTERRRAEDTLRYLAELTPSLHASLGLHDTLEALSRSAVPLLADYSIVDLVEGGAVRRSSAWHHDPARAKEMDVIRGAAPRPDRADQPLMQAIRTGEPILLPEVTEAHIRSIAVSEAHLAALRSLAPRSVMVVPVPGGGGVLALLTLVFSDSGRRYGESDLSLAGELARRAGVAVENARLHEAISEAREEMELRGIELEQQVEESQALNEELEQTASDLAEVTRDAEEARDAASAAERYVRGILESITDPFVVTDPEWRYVYINDAAEEVFRESGHGNRQAMIGRNLWELFPEIADTEFGRTMRTAVEEQRSTMCEELYRRTGRWSEIRCYPMPGGGLATSWKDITQRRREENARRYLERTTELLASSLDDEETLASLAELVVPELGDWCGITVADEDGALRPIAAAHSDPSKTALARELNERFPPDPNAPAGAAAVMRTGEPQIIAEVTDELLEKATRGPDHLRLIRELGLRSALVVPLIARGRALGALTLAYAESDRRYGAEDLALATELARRAALAVDNARLYRQALAARHEAERANRAKSEFLTIMSHELRTPLNAIAGYAQLMELGVRGPVSEAQRSDLERIRQSQQHLLSLINDVLNYARLEAARVQYVVEPLRVRDALAELETLVRPQLIARMLEYRFVPPPDDLVALGDPEKVRQILLNLLTNAIKFTDPGGLITLEAEGDDRKVRIHLSDTGRGIAPEYIDSIFEPFVQVQRSLSSSQEGTGLGLSISRDLARGMEGDVLVSSRLGEGSRFSLVLRRAE